MPGQPRTLFDEPALLEMAKSIETEGLIQPIVVRKVQEGLYELIAGERRWRASQIAGLERIAAIIKDVDSSRVYLHALIENIHRQDLTPVEEAYSLDRIREQLIEEGLKGTHEEIADRIGKSRKWVTTTLSILKLSKMGLAYFKENPGLLSKGHAITLQGLRMGDEVHLIEQVLYNNWSVRRLEKEAARIKATYRGIQPEATQQTDADLLRLSTKISEVLGAEAKIKVNPNTEAVDLEIRTWGVDAFEGILDRLGIKYDA